ncbi:urotensin-2B precursor [Mus musculus]|uniref:Urotensin-2B n=2 Tax=Mus musculus TaxID=10090 RepID=UTS2B_MOUSE|nr:urotensin-2B precursor [Mus musculus]Q765I1.1 RecName: Full=Urotensin-2B; AltName: Full=Urotensin II-related peptide; AltName: Full=Urotensin IIB; Short=U-IIB; Short=UIIB; AltName: Full=Urotensin-2 domain-containing protein; Flags: Precursor [Mus musculus]AAI17025.1 Urotensin 2 domain containing [Mus musculus]AAI17027.1 Urotensin 2 domain containing [Mus musculus]AAQ83885.1 urotensin IIB precursor [Mus musculus]EDK97698.1 urotensin 2 domain containing [Mus musculus]BAC98928.1 urotensin II-|eukprot:NP_937809.1 urotensin-2B precursor [Mus musculus]
MKVFSTSLWCGLLTLLSVMNLFKSVRGRPHLSSGHELFPAKEHAAQEKLTRNPGLQRPFHAGGDLPSKLEELRQVKKLRDWIMEAKNTGLSNALDNLSSSHTKKRACFWKYCV